MRLYYFYDEILCEDCLHGTVDPTADECHDTDAQCVNCGAKVGD